MTELWALCQHKQVRDQMGHPVQQSKLSLFVRWKQYGSRILVPCVYSSWDHETNNYNDTHFHLELKARRDSFESLPRAFSWFGSGFNPLTHSWKVMYEHVCANLKQSYVRSPYRRCLHKPRGCFSRHSPSPRKLHQLLPNVPHSVLPMGLRSLPWIQNLWLINRF